MLFMAAERQTAASCILRTWSHAVACAPSQPRWQAQNLLLVSQGQSGLIPQTHQCSEQCIADLVLILLLVSSAQRQLTALACNI
jgi:hypothetical protein